MFFPFLFLFLTVDGRLFHGSPNAPKKYCPPDFEYNDVDKCFRYVPQKKNYFSAELYCVNLGSHLTSVRNMYDNAFISQQLDPTPPNQSEYTWLGLTNQVNGSWSWVNGEPLIYTNWDPQSYPQSTPFNCSAINSTNTRWAVFDCSKEFSFVCSVDASESSGTTCNNGTQVEKPLCPTGFSVFPPTDSCYKIVEQHSYGQAKQICKSYGAHLVRLTWEKEEEFLQDLAAHHSPKEKGVYVCKMPMQ